jgi:hypothetical protein
VQLHPAGHLLCEHRLGACRDACAGAIDPIAAYSKDRDSVRVPVDSAPYGVTVIALSGDGHGTKPGARHAVSTTTDVRYDKDGTLLARATYTAALDDGRTASTVIKQVAPQRTLTSRQPSAKTTLPPRN